MEPLYNSEVFLKAFDEKDNYIIEEDENSSSDICAIYFSSMAIYNPTTEESFEKNIIQKNKFEWYKTRYPYAKKHIFIRDNYKLFYIYGINKSLCSIEKVTTFLKKETSGYRTVTIGSSAGGYAALFTGVRLNSLYIISFSGYFDVLRCCKNKWRDLNTCDSEIQSNLKINIPQTYTGSIIHFSAWLHKEDRDQVINFDQKNNHNIYIIRLLNNHHGVSINAENIVRLFAMNNESFVSLIRTCRSGLNSRLSLIYRINRHKGISKALSISIKDTVQILSAKYLGAIKRRIYK